ncbi:MAG: hypothetical protein U9N44_07975, partial [Chloroflexota bacterium]|nr:hypothetical protein [Chloroflexota bacterium]
GVSVGVGVGVGVGVDSGVGDSTIDSAVCCAGDIIVISAMNVMTIIAKVNLFAICTLLKSLSAWTGEFIVVGVRTALEEYT